MYRSFRACRLYMRTVCVSDGGDKFFRCCTIILCSSRIHTDTVHCTLLCPGGVSSGSEHITPK